MKAIVQAANRVGGVANRVGSRVGGAANRAGFRVGKWAASGAGGAVASTFLQAFDWAYGRALDGLPGFDGAAELAAKYAARDAGPRPRSRR